MEPRFLGRLVVIIVTVDIIVVVVVVVVGIIVVFVSVVVHPRMLCQSARFRLLSAFPRESPCCNSA